MSILIYKSVRAWLILASFMLYWSSAAANVFVNPHSINLNLYLGNMTADETAGVLEGSSSHVAVGLGSSSRSRSNPFLAVDLELWDLSSEYRYNLQPPLFVANSDDMALTTSAITLGARLSYPYDTPYRFYLSAGYGYFASNLRVYANLLGTPDYYEDSTETFAPYLGAGFTIELGHRQTMELFYRKWNVKGDFSRFNIPETDIGGEAIGLGFGMYW